ALNDVQVFTVNATDGFFSLSMAGRGMETAPIRWDASAEEVRAALQFALERNIIKTDVEVARYGNTYIVSFEGQLRDVSGGSPIPLMVANTTPGSGITPLQGSVSIGTRMDGIIYYGIETINLKLGSTGNAPGVLGDVLNVQGTSPGSTATLTPRSVTNVTFG